MHEAASRVISAVRGVDPRTRSRQDSETAQIRAFLHAGHPLLAFSVIVVRRLATCAVLASTFLLMH